MRGFAGVVLLLFVGALGCSETTASGGAGGDGGSAGSGGWIGNCGPHGFGGGAAFLAPGLWRNNPGGQEEDVCFYVNEDCTRLVPSTECDIGEDDEAAHLLEIQWANGLNESGEQCNDGSPPRRGRWTTTQYVPSNGEQTRAVLNARPGFRSPMRSPIQNQPI